MKEFSGTTGGYYSIIANPFPVSTDLLAVVNEGLTAVSYDDMYSIGNEILVRVGNNYKHYYFINDAIDENDNDVEGDVWADDGGYVVTAKDVIAAGASFWIKAMQNGGMTFSL